MSPGKAAFFGALAGVVLVGAAIVVGMIWESRSASELRDDPPPPKKVTIDVEASPVA